MLNDFAVGPFVFDFTNSALDEKPAGGSALMRFVASITVFPSIPCTMSRASGIAPPGTATTTASTSAMSPPSRPIRVTSWPALSQRSASPPPTLPLPSTAIFISSLLPRFRGYHESTSFSENKPSRNCPKSLGRPYNVALWDTEMVLFGPFWRSYTGQIYGRNPAPTPFRTVSEEKFSETRPLNATIIIRPVGQNPPFGRCDYRGPAR